MSKLKSNVKRLTNKEVDLIEALREAYEVEESTSTRKVSESSKGLKTWLVLSDIHVPGHNKKLIGDILSIISEYPIEGIVFAGDFLDLYSIGSYNRNSLANLKDWSLSKEYDMGNELLDEFDRVLSPDTKKVFIFGNHEDRLDREFKHLDTAKYGEALLSVRKGLKLDERGYEVLEDYPDGVFRIGNDTRGVDIIHGQRINKYPAAATLLDNGGSVILCHTHRFSIFRDQQGTGYNIGCLIDIDNPLFGYMTRMQRKKWANAFAVVTEDADGNTFVEPIEVTDNKFFYRGKIY